MPFPLKKKKKKRKLYIIQPSFEIFSKLEVCFSLYLNVLLFCTTFRTTLTFRVRCEFLIVRMF